MLERSLRIYWSVCPGLEPSTYRKLFAHFGCAQDLPEADEADWLAAARLRPETVNQMRAWREAAPQRLEYIESRVAHDGTLCIVQGDELYPPQLYDLFDPPVVLFALGNPALLQNPRLTVAIVGTRRASGYGLEVTRWLSSCLSQHGLTVISGMALGIDACASETALIQGVPSIAVLGCGVEVCYPQSNQKLYDALMNRGLLLSEYSPKSLAAKHHFPERNRLIAALSTATVVVQAGEKSGSLRTAQSALELGRDVYVVPGPITSKSFRGSHQLLVDGAIPLVDPQSLVVDLLGTVSAQVARARSVESRTPAHLRMLVNTMLEEGPLRAGELAQLAGQSPGHIYAALLELELGGIVKRLSDGRYKVALSV